MPKFIRATKEMITSAAVGTMMGLAIDSELNKLLLFYNHDSQEMYCYLDPVICTDSPEQEEQMISEAKTMTTVQLLNFLQRHTNVPDYLPVLIEFTGIPGNENQRTLDLPHYTNVLTNGQEGYNSCAIIIQGNNGFHTPWGMFVSRIRSMGELPVTVFNSKFPNIKDPKKMLYGPHIKPIYNNEPKIRFDINYVHLTFEV